MKVQTILEQMGYQPHEAKVYLAALELGEATTAQLAQHAEMPRTTVMEVAEHMRKKGLLIMYTKKNHKYWLAENPDKILALFKSNEQAFQNILPDLVAMQKNQASKPMVRTFSGSDVYKVMDDIIETRQHVSALISMEDWFKFFGTEATQDFIRRRYKSFLKMRMISPRTETAVRLKKNDQQELRHLKFLPLGIDLRQITNFIYGDKIAIISFNKKEPTAVIIEDTDVASANLLYFEELWKHSLEN